MQYTSPTTSIQNRQLIGNKNPPLKNACSTQTLYCIARIHFPCNEKTMGASSQYLDFNDETRTLRPHCFMLHSAMHSKLPRRTIEPSMKNMITIADTFHSEHVLAHSYWILLRLHDHMCRSTRPHYNLHPLIRSQVSIVTRATKPYSSRRWLP